MARQLARPCRLTGARSSALTLALAGACMVIGLAPEIARAQDVQTGHYIPGWNAGLKAGIMAPHPGFYMASTTHFYNADTTRDGSGNKVPGAGTTDSIITELAFVWRPDIKLLGADYQAVVAPSVGNLSGRPVLVGSQYTDPPVGLSDTFFSPINLGWHWPEFHLVASLAGFAPTGKYTFGADDNTGMGFWTVMPYTVGTYRTTRGIFENMPLLAMGAVRYEWHTEQEGRDFRPGDTLTVEWGLGLEITDKADVGISGNFYRQATDATGADAVPVEKYKANGIGAVFSYGFSAVDLGLRVYRDYDVQNGPEGTAVFLEIGWGWPRAAE